MGRMGNREVFSEIRACAVSPVAILLFAAALLIAGRFAIADLTPATDSASYIETARYLGGDDVALHPERILKPFAPLGILAIQRVSSLSFDDAFLVEIILGFLLLIASGYWFFREFFRERKHAELLAIAGTILLAGGYPMLKYGLDLYTETGAMAFFMAGLALTVLAARDPSWRNILLATSVGVLGILWKEYSALQLLSLGLVILFAKELSYREKFLRWGAMAAIGGVFLGGWLAYVYVVYDYSYADWFRLGGATGTLPLDNGLLAITKSLLGVAMLAWIPAAYGVFRHKEMEQRELRIAILLAIPCVAIFTWGYAISRLYYVAAPVVLVFALHGISQLIERRPWVLPLAVSLVLASDFVWLALSDALRPAILAFFA